MSTVGTALELVLAFDVYYAMAYLQILYLVLRLQRSPSVHLFEVTREIYPEEQDHSTISAGWALSDWSVWLLLCGLSGLRGLALCIGSLGSGSVWT